MLEITVQNMEDNKFTVKSLSKIKKDLNLHPSNIPFTVLYGLLPIFCRCELAVDHVGEDIVLVAVDLVT